MFSRQLIRVIAAGILSVFVSFASAGISSAGYNEWTPVGPYGGLVLSLAASPDYETDHTVYAGAWYGLFVSTDGGASWSQLTGYDSDAVEAFSLAISPGFTSDGTIFTCSITSSGIYKSTDRGVNWSLVHEGEMVFDLQVTPSYISDQTVFAGTMSGVLKSTDGGTNWSQANTGLWAANINSVAVSPAYSSDQTVFAGTGNGVYKTTDRGNTWFSSYSGITYPNPIIVDVALSPSYPSDHTVFCANRGDIYRSTDGGAFWTKVYSGSAGNYMNDIEFSPSFDSDGTVFATTSEAGILRSTDGGDNWTVVQEISAELGLAVSPAYSSDSTVFAGYGLTYNNDDGVIKSVDGGDNWSAANDGLNAQGTDYMDASPDPAEPGTLFVLRGPKMMKSADGGASWSLVFALDSSEDMKIVEMSPAYSTDQTAFLASRLKLYKSMDGGQNWSYTNLTLQSAETPMFIGLSPGYTSDQTVFVGSTKGVYKTTDGGATWNSSSNGIPTNKSVSSIVFSPNYISDQTAFLTGGYVSGSAVYKTTDGGSNWSPIFYGSIGNLTISPEYTTDLTLYATLSGSVYKTTDGGSTWNTFSSGIDDLHIGELEISPDYQNDRTLYAGSSCGGFYRSVNGGISWHSRANGMPSPPCIQEIRFSADYANDRTVYAASTAQGVWVMTDAHAGAPELTHYYWDGWLTGWSCSECHQTPQTFLQAGFNETDGHCYTCHNPAASAHELILTQRGHGVMASITSAGITQPTYGSGSPGEFDNRMYANLIGDKVGCITCHNIMQKAEDTGRSWEMTTTSDNIAYSLQNGEWESYGHYVPRVYRDTSLWGGPGYVKNRKDYLVDPSEYSYDESAGTVTFNQAQDPAAYIYVTLYYPSLRVSTEGNRLCADCHTQDTHMGVNCLVCHAAHNSGNNSFIRDKARLPNRSSASVVFTSNTGTNSFADGDTTYDGVCEVCHTQTKYHRKDGSGFANHSGGVNQSGSDCTACHTHASGFAK